MKHKKQQYRRIIKIICGVLIAIGLFFTFGTAGASDHFKIDVSQVFIQLFISNSLMAIGFIGIYWIERSEVRRGYTDEKILSWDEQKEKRPRNSQ